MVRAVAMEAWRWRRVSGTDGAARRGTLSASEAASDVVGFSDVPPGLVNSYEWKSLQARAWKHELAEPIHLKELRGGLWVVRHWRRSLKNRRKVFLLLNDNLGIALAWDKGRASDPRINYLLRRVCAYCLATQIRVRCRWIMSEINPSDVGSRQFDASSNHLARDGECLLPEKAVGSAREQQQQQQEQPEQQTSAELNLCSCPSGGGRLLKQVQPARTASAPCPVSTNLRRRGPQPSSPLTGARVSHGPRGTSTLKPRSIVRQRIPENIPRAALPGQSLLESNAVAPGAAAAAAAVAAAAAAAASRAAETADLRRA